MWEYPFTGENPFNVCAQEICHLHELNPEQFNFRKERDSVIPPENLKEAVDALFEKMPVINNTAELLDSGVPAGELAELHHWEYYDDFIYLLEFLSRYTRNLPYAKILKSSFMFSLTHNQDGKDVEFEALNDNQEETGLMILPLVSTINDPLNPAEDGMVSEDGDPYGEKPPGKHWATDRMQGIQNELSNIYYVEKDQMSISNGSYQVRNSILNRGLFPQGKKTWKVAVCPIAHRELITATEYTKTGKGVEQGFFAIAGLKDEAFIYNRIKADFIAAAELNADVIMFPEMLGDEHILSKSFFREIAQILRDNNQPMPNLILAPTWWHNGRNELYVFTGSMRKLCIQQKQYPYVYEKSKEVNLKEDLIDPERVIHVVHIPEVGRFAFPICRDFLEEDYLMLLLRQLRVTFLLCPSFSSHKTQFQMEAMSGNKYGCYTIWNNTCAAYWKSDVLPEQIGLAAGPQEDLRKAMEYMTPGCQGKCGEGKESCIFLVEINMDHSANISCRHVKQ